MLAAQNEPGPVVAAFLGDVMFQRKSELQNFIPTPIAPEPQVGTILPPVARTDWDVANTDEPRPPNRQAVEAQVIGNETIISADLTIIGNVLSKGRVKLEGTIEGDMRCRSLVVGEQGSVTGAIVAEDVAVYGRVAGIIRGDAVTLYSSAHVEGDIYHHGIGIEMGTHYDGRLKWTDNPTAGQDQLYGPNSHNSDAFGIGLVNGRS
jgi:cytoskeletal protein CcmA (bactofilin family)